MDKTETFIRMSDCPEIQDQWQYKMGDWYCDNYSHKVGANVIETDIEAGYIGDHYYTKEERIQDYKDDGSIWLPTQDRLQTMCFLETHDLLGNLKRFYDWATKWEGSKRGNSTAVWQNGSGFTSMEQLLLAFLMKEKYNKAWHGEKWE